jgi:AcrR family transcriptional regulator
MTPPPRRRAPDKRPDAILDAALEVFSKHGYAAAKVEEIARLASVSKGTVYLYFPTKRAMIEALVEQSSARIADAASGLATKHADDDPVVALRAVFRLLFKTISDPDISAATRIVMGEGARFPELAAHYRARVIETGHATLERLVARGVKQGSLRRVDLDVANRALIGPAVTQLLMKTIFKAQGDLDYDPDQMAEASFDLLLNGLRNSD